MTESIVLGGGCYWCLDAAYRLVTGVTQVVSGYAGGTRAQAEYYTVASGQTDHAEVVQVTYDPSIITLADILDIFWTIHDPTTPDRQGHDVGPQYRSVIFYANDQQKQTAATSMQTAQALFGEPIITQLQQLMTFYPAEDYHQNFYQNNQEAPYCQVVIDPKLQKLRAKFADRLQPKPRFQQNSQQPNQIPNNTK